MIEIIEAAEATNLTTIAAVKSELGLTGSDQDARIEALITQASASISTFCDRTFGRETVRETVFDRNAVDSLVLSRWPITLVNSVTVSGTALDGDGYVVDKQAGLLYRRTATSLGWYWPGGETVIEYVSGYLLPGEDGRDLPADIERAAILLVAGAFHATGRDPLLRSEDTHDVATFTYFASGSGMSMEVLCLLAGFRRRTVG